MSPAPQGNPEVEKYIGSYLISQRIPPGAKSSSATKRFQNQHAKQKSPETEKVRNFNKYCFPQRDHARYPVPPLQSPLPVEYNGNHQHYKHPGGWAGVPLISMTSGNHRRNKKTPSAPGNGQIHKFQPKHPQQNGFAKGKEPEESRVDSDRSPLTRLAIHTQGAPLIQAGRYNGNRCRNGYNRDQTRVFRGDCGRWDAAKDSKAPAGVQSQNQACGSVDSSSVASDESSGNSENSLPRIIKPRKRRKKDRKPLTGTAPIPSSSNESNQYSGEQDQKAESNFKTYLPLCFEHESANAKENTKDLLGGNSLITIVDEKQSEDLIDTFTSDEFPFGNLLDDEEDKDSELSASATLCQCRYCDPSGVIWDVDQRCYSPFLTPPSPTDPKLIPFSTSLPLTFPHITPYVVESSSSQNPRYYFNPDLGPVLRRSWSDPSSNKKPANLQTPNAESEQEKPDCRPCSPLGLQVSSEIVTSPNGHRDIEIKFYSSSSPLESKISASGRSRNERCFAVEE